MKIRDLDIFCFELELGGMGCSGFGASTLLAKSPEIFRTPTTSERTRDRASRFTIVDLTRVAGLRSVVDALAIAVCQLEYEQSVARTRVDYVTAAEGAVTRVEQHHVIHRKGTH